MKWNCSLWQCLDQVEGLSAAFIHWEHAFEGAFHAFEPYLRPTSRRATRIPCPTPCEKTCYRHVIEHAPNDWVAACPEGLPALPLSKQDILVYEVNVRKLCGTLAYALHIEPGYEPILGLPKAWRLGIYSATPMERTPVFLSLYREPASFKRIAVELLFQNSIPLIVLGMIRANCPGNVEALLRKNNSVYAPLEELVAIETQEIRVLRELKSFLSSKAATTEEIPVAAQTIGRYKCDDGIHWTVNGIDKGIFFKRKNAIKAKIIEILFEQIGNGWIPHATFMHACGWSRERYFGEANEPKIIQKHPTDIRNFLGVDVEFRIEYGIRFAEHIVKSREAFSRVSFSLISREMLPF